jgi:2-oxoglutarate ferredoxin oxidoreductase subunit delta
MGKVVIKAEYCKGCELCTTACSQKLLKPGKRFSKGGYYTIEFCDEKGLCTACTLCAVICPDAAIEVWK